MPTRISADLVITLVSLLFIAMIPIDCKITNFFLHLFVLLFWVAIKLIFLGAHPIIYLRQPVHFVFTHFQPITLCYKQRKTLKASLKPTHYYRNTECTIARPSYWYKSGCVTLTWCIITLHLLPALWMFGYMYHLKQRITQEVPLLALHLPKSLTEALYNVGTTNCHLATW